MARLRSVVLPAGKGQRVLLIVNINYCDCITDGLSVSLGVSTLVGITNLDIVYQKYESGQNNDSGKIIESCKVSDKRKGQLGLVMRRNLDIGTLRTFITVVEMAGVTRAANKLHLTQSAVSMQLKRLEELVGISLLTRDSRGMCATTEGMQLLSYAKKLVQVNDEALGRLLQRAEGGEVRFGVSNDIVEPHVPRILKQFVQNYPQVSVRLFCKHSAKLLERFKAGKLDVIITTELHSGQDCKQLLERDLIWTGAVRGNGWRQDTLPLAFTRLCMFRKPAIESLDAAGISWVDAVDSGNNFDAGAIACAADIGIRADIRGFKPRGMAEVDDTDNRLPNLPTYFLNLYTAEPVGSSNDKVIQEFARLVEDAFTVELEKDQPAPA